MAQPYYKEISLSGWPHNTGNPWTINFSCGLEFTCDGRPDLARPILFILFGDNPTDERIARHPLSIGSLLEAIAMHAEICTVASLCMQILDPDVRRTDLLIRSKEWERILYDPELTDYTAAVHLLSTRIKITEMVVAYRLAASLATACLNLTQKHFSQLRHPEKFKHFGLDRIEAFKAAGDRGFAFACIAFSAPQYFVAEDEGIWLNSALSSAGLPDVETIQSDAMQHMNQVSRQVTKRWILDYTRDYLLAQGRSIAFLRAQMSSDTSLTSINKAGIPVPQIFDSEADLFSVSSVNLDPIGFNAEAMHTAECNLDIFTRNFLTACRIARWPPG